MRIAITRDVSPSIGHCELTHLARQPIDVELARRQHRQYEAMLGALGCEVHSLPAAPDLPDSVFVEDIAIVFTELAILTHPGAPSRRPEVPAVAESLRSYRKLAFITVPGILDGGDVLCIGKRVWIGLSERSNRTGIDQMNAVLAPLGYVVEGVPVTGCLHLKSAVTQVAEDAVLLNPAWVEDTYFAGMNIITVDPAELYAANALLIGSDVVYPTAYPRTRERLERRGIRVHSVEVSELIKAEGAVTCCSLIFEV